MKHIKTIALCLIFMMASSLAYAESSYDISELYSVIKAPTGTKAVGTYDKTVEVKPLSNKVLKRFGHVGKFT